MANFFIAFLFSISFAPLFIEFTKRFQFKQNVRDLGPDSHRKKSGTPTLGGVIFLFSLTITTLVFVDLNPQILLLLFLTLGNGLIGFSDDFIKIYFKRNLGLTSKQKLFGQLLVSGLFLYFLSKSGIDTSIFIPILDKTIDLSIFYYLFIVFLIVGTTNATNLTDGLDGLLTGTSMIAFAAFGLIALISSNWPIFFFSLAFIGALTGFLFFNRNPAQIFMGDTGSLAIGGALVGMAIILKVEIILAVIGAVFVIETLSVIIQVISFKFRKKRVFKMSPIHHHFELSGFEEKVVVKGFYFAGAFFGCLGVAILMI
jgi:phospho-N-acetylmuramoyl-pentapeptide-transferase